MNNWCVYKHTTPSGKVYIGITHQKPMYRWRDGKGYKNNAHFHNAIQKYGWANMSHEVLFAGLTQGEAEDIERRLILQLKSYDKRYGYNKALGGHALSEESRRRIANTRKIRGHTSPTKGKHLSEETRRKISAANKGNCNHTVWTKEQRDKMSKSKRGDKNPNYGKPMSEKQKQALKDAHRRPVVMVGEEEIVFASVLEAGQYAGVFPGNISRVCRGERKTAGGKVWRYA